MSYKIVIIIAFKVKTKYIQPNRIEITLPETVTGGSLNLEELVWLFVELDVLGSTVSLGILGRLDFFSVVFVDLLVLAGIEKVFSSSMVMAISQKYIVVLLSLMILNTRFDFISLSLFSRKSKGAFELNSYI